MGIPQAQLYNPLDIGSKDIRLLSLSPGADGEELICSLSQYSLPNAPTYEALSYTWQNPAHPIDESINLQESKFNVTWNLHEALCHLRTENTTRTLWIDAICINQDDLDERAQQVPFMKDIYRNAGHVVVWLG
ncbi:HET-domain-containing protein, partial [Didymella exigua CBS 183.55]